MATEKNSLSGQDPAVAERIRQQKAKQSYDSWVKWCERNEIKLEKEFEALVPGSLIRAAMRVVDKKRKLWLEELEKKNAAIRFAIENKQTLGDHYWQNEYFAYQLYYAAQRIYNAILQASKENENDHCNS